MTNINERATRIAKSVLRGELDPLLACREIAAMREQLPVAAHEVMNVFIAVASEVDDLPIGPERAHWNVKSLREKDLEAEKYRSRVRGEVAEALQNLLEAIRNHSPS